MMYLAIAYRWGWTNSHHYFLYAGNDRTKAIALAQVEPQDRGGKYATVVLEFNEDGTKYETIAFFKSLYDEERLVHNYRIDMLEHLGHVVEWYAESGKASLPDPDKPGYLKTVDVGEAPQWLRDEVARSKEHYKLREEAFANARKAAQPEGDTS